MFLASSPTYLHMQKYLSCQFLYYSCLEGTTCKEVRLSVYSRAKEWHNVYWSKATFPIRQQSVIENRANFLGTVEMFIFNIDVWWRSEYGIAERWRHTHTVFVLSLTRCCSSHMIMVPWSLVCPHWQQWEIWGCAIVLGRFSAFF